MDVALIVSLLKQSLGIMSTVRDSFLEFMVEGVIRELTEEKGIVLDPDDAAHIMFIVDYADWRYKSRDSDGAVPRHLQFRLHNLIIHSGGGG